MDHQIPESTKASRIKQALEYYKQSTGEKISWSCLAKALNMSVSAPTNWKRNKVSNETLKGIANYLGVSYLWLLTNTGSMLTLNTSKDQSLEAKDPHHSLISSVGQLFVQWLKTNNESVELQRNVLQLTEQLKLKPDMDTQAQIIKLQSQAIQSQHKAQNLYLLLYSKANEVVLQD
ncbi:hypothetical protein MUB04_15855 [Acinetobacter indicus]|uniref:hypothetical protein n=1 Tax=Acinetobacter TaxID=469 RepID=UPI0015D359B2|nr:MULTISPECIES: hypothetical protein [Acinetobacter]MCP0918013.1 hypothetical protein [Acinetobacter indicus]